MKKKFLDDKKKDYNLFRGRSRKKKFHERRYIKQEH